MNSFMCFWMILLWIFGTNAMKVSMYGNGFIAVPLQEAKLSTNIRLKFRTHQQNALIFLAAGRTDYCLLKLEYGRIAVIYKIDETSIELWSPKKVRWNDLEWHDVAVQRYESNITMQVDEHITRKFLPININELNVHFGTFLGGVGDFSESYLTEIDNFRGCISDVFYNNINILKRAKERTSHATSVGVTWNCSTEFDASITDSISFIEENSFMILKRNSNQSTESWSFDIRTIEEDGIIFVNHGVDFILVEILNGKLRFLLGKGVHVIEIESHEIISDGRWHNVIIQYNIGMVEIVVDNILTTASFRNDSNSDSSGVTIPNFDNYYYFGGVTNEVKKRSHYKGLHVSEISFKGCMKNILFNNEMIGLPHMKATYGVDVHCAWKYPCIEKMPCIMSGLCRQYRLDEFICYCDQAYCLKADYAEPYKVFTQSETNAEIELLRISPLQLSEGGSVFLSPLYIEILFDYTIFTQTESAILFHIVQPPKYGNVLRLQSSSEYGNFTSTKTFSLIDLNTDKIKYVHNGKEYFNDHMTIDLQINEDKNVPDYHFGKHRFVLHVNITPINDAPILNIASNKILRVTQGIPKIVGSNLLHVKDPDSPPHTLIYSILGSINSKWKYGNFQVNDVPVNKFSQAEINQGSVTFLFNSSVAEEDISYDLNIQVSDGIETSDAVLLPVSVHPLKLRIVNNTGLVMVHLSSAIITPWNLSVSPSPDEDNIDVLYTIKQHPQYGIIQKLRPIDSSWVSVDDFRNSQIILGQIRYYHNKEYPQQDEFKFYASFGSAITQDFDFRITFTKLKIVVVTKRDLVINGSKDFIIDSNYLSYQTTPLPTFSRNIIYTIQEATKYGNIYVDGYPKHAKEMDSFTQYDIDRYLIRYRTHKNSYASFTDTLKFMVSVSECADVFGYLKFTYNPESSLKDRLSYRTKESLKVKEGEAILITKNNFDIIFDTFSNLTFILSHPPQHGYLCNSQIEHLKRFTLQKLYNGDIFYCHDDSESVEDSFEMLILSNDNVNFQYVTRIHVDIMLLNDNVPHRAFDTVFYVVNNSSRTINQNSLLYVDGDVNTNLSDIRYNHVTCFNGKFYKFGQSHMSVDRFTQDDINNNRIIFKHSGPAVGTASFIVTDGLHEVPGVLEIQAMEPFITVVPSNASIVQEGKYVVIRSSDIVIKTNLDMKFDEVVYTVRKAPSYGVLNFLKDASDSRQHYTLTNFTSLNNFTQFDVERERLAYWNTEVASMDKISYQISIRNVTADGEIVIRIYPSAYWEPLKVQQNKTLYVEESTSVLISRNILEVIHPSISPGDITYLVTSSPLHGYLEIQSMTSDDEYNCKVFDQSTINSEKIFYIQAGVNQSIDHFTFDVTNGITWLRNLMLKIVIIPENLYIETMPLVVVEGKTTTINSTFIQPYSEFYKGKILEYKIVKKPSFGYITSSNSQVTRFTQKQLESDLVQYIHDGSENRTDLVILIANAKNKESTPFTLNIEIIPVNDEPPVLVTNTGLQVWNGGKYIIRNSDIMARDQDSPPENLTFLINHIYGGYLAHIIDLSVKIDEFTQQQIDNQEICFVHDANAKLNEINFIVTDGLFNTSEQILYISANPVILTKVHNNKLHVFPLTKKQILSEHLYFECSDKNRLIFYNITLRPEFGRIFYEYPDSGHSVEVTEFNQNDINNGRIFYEHTTSMLQFKMNDSFFYDVYAENTNRLVSQKFDIEISVSSGGLLRFLPVSKLHMDEGGSAPIKLDFNKILEYLKTRAGMRNPEVYIKINKPMHGSVTSISYNENSDVFYPSDFMSQRVYYFHDHSDTSNDIILMEIYLAQGNILLCNLSIPVTINPVNDQPFELITHSPNINVVEGENVTITKNELLTQDADTLPEDIIYEVISGPTLGLLMKLSSNGDAQDLLAYGNQFSQADINKGRIIYVHYGNTRPTTFYFKVSDGKFKPSYVIFNINVQPVFVTCDKEQNNIRIQQGENAVTLERAHIGINTNAHQERILYNITNSPLNGIILFNHQPTLYFNQSQLINHELLYMQTDISKPNDTFQVYAYISDTNCGSSCEIRITIDPFIKINAISIIEGDKIRLTSTITSDDIITTKLNKFNPKIFIKIPPNAGTIRKIIRNSGGTEILNDKDISMFTYKELKSGVVYYVARKLPENLYSLNDSFEYLVSVKSMQPARSTVLVEIHSFKRKTDDLLSAGGGIYLQKANGSAFNYIVILCALIGLILLSCITLIIIRFLYKSRKKRNQIEKDIPPNLPRPSDFMILSSNNVYSPSENESIPATSVSTPLPCLSNIPHCKITPLGNHESELEGYDMDEDATDEMDEIQQMVQNPYQLYADHDDWISSCEVPNDMDYQTIQQQQQQQATNPLLRRNQYWV